MLFLCSTASGVNNRIMLFAYLRCLLIGLVMAVGAEERPSDASDELITKLFRDIFNFDSKSSAREQSNYSPYQHIPRAVNYANQLFPEKEKESVRFL